MSSRRVVGLSSALFAIFLLMSPALQAQPIVVAHRGASGYVPEHTLEAKSMAHAMGADYIEQDVVLTKDDQAIVLHDISLNSVTNVQELFPNRQRDDGRYYAIDFLLSEIKQLRVHERLDEKTGKPAFPRRFPSGKSSFQIPTLIEEIELIQGLNHSTGREAGIYTELKSPAWHRKQGKDISRVVFDILNRYGYSDKPAKIYLQCFETAELKRWREEFNSKLKLIQLVDGSSWREDTRDLDPSKYPGGLTAIAEYAEGIGPSMVDVVRPADDASGPTITSITEQAHAKGLDVHPYTLRADALPKYARSFDDLLDIFFVQARVDGAFTDFPDQAVRFRNSRIR